MDNQKIKNLTYLRKYLMSYLNAIRTYQLKYEKNTEKLLMEPDDKNFDRQLIVDNVQCLKLANKKALGLVMEVQQIIDNANETIENMYHIVIENLMPILTDVAKLCIQCELTAIEEDY